MAGAPLHHRPSAGSTRRPILQRYNCLPCRRRKSKCDRAEPCLSCVLRGTEEYCYTDKELPPVTASSSGKHTPAHSPTHSGSHRDGPGPSRPSKAAKVGHEQVESVHSSQSGKTAALQTALDSMAASLQDVRKLISAGATRENLSQWGTMIDWDDVEALLPPDNECREIFHCFFTDLEWYQRGVERKSFEGMWNSARTNREPIARHRVAMICAVVAFTLLLAPRSHPASRLSEKSTTNPRWQIENARLLLEAHYHFPTHKEEDDDDGYASLGSDEDILGQLQAETLFCYYCAVAGLLKKAWFSLGKAIRLGKSIDLFDESRWKVAHGRREERRGIAWDLITMDRWCSMHIGRPGELMSLLNVGRPTISQPYAIWRDHLSELIMRVLEFMQRSPAMEMKARVSYAFATDAEVVDFYGRIPAELQFPRARERLADHDAVAMRNAAPSLTFYLSHLFLRCTLARPFLMDPAAPVELRFASLQHARTIIEAMPHLVALATSPYASFPPAWNSQFLFIAAATFASVVLSREDSRARGMIWPDEELDWFAAAIFDVVETFDLVSHGAQNHTARTCKNLLVGLCTSRETLRKRFQERERTRLEEVLGHRQKGGPASKRTSLPSVFSPNSNSQEAYARFNGTRRKAGQLASRLNEVSTTYSSIPDPIPTGASSSTPASSSSALTPDITPLSASEVLASMSAAASSATNGMQGGGFGTDPFTFELPFLDPQEWAHLTANLDTATGL